MAVTTVEGVPLFLFLGKIWLTECEEEIFSSRTCMFSLAQQMSIVSTIRFG